MSRPAELYHRAIVQAARAARGAGRLPDADATATVDNPLCGDRVRVDLRLDGAQIAAVGHEVRGCLLCEAAASVIGECAPGRTPEALRSVAREVAAMLGEAAGAPVRVAWPALEMFAPARAFRSRHRCVTLPFEALGRALDAAQAPAPGGAGPR